MNAYIYTCIRALILLFCMVRGGGSTAFKKLKQVTTMGIFSSSKNIIPSYKVF